MPGPIPTKIFPFLIFVLACFNSSSQVPTYLMKNGTLTSCSGYLLDEGGYSTGYQGGTKILTIISPDNRPFGMHIDTAHFVDDYDKLFIYDGSDDKAPLLSIIGNQGGSRGVRTTGNTLTIKFYASGYGTVGKFGFRAKFSCLDNPQVAEFMTISNKLWDGNMDLADYDSDGDLDILEKGVIYRNDAAPDSLLYFDKSVSPLGNWYYSSFTTADLDGDGDKDVFVIGRNPSTGSLEPKLYLNDGAGKFKVSSPTFYPAFQGTAKAVDFNNDGKMDISYIGQSSYTVCTFKLYLNNGNGTFTEKSTAVPGLSASNLDWGDSDNDGDVDLIIHGNNLNSTYTKLYINNSGTLSELSMDLVGTESGTVRWIDIDKDGKLDLFYTGVHNIGSIYCIPPQILLNKGNNKFEKLPNNLPEWFKMTMDFADYDNDNDLDIVATGGGDVGVASNVAIFKNEGNGQFKKIDIASYGNAGAYWKDFNNDGRLDVFAATSFDRSIVAKNMGNDLFQACSLPLPAIDGKGHVALSDMDGDGRDDIIFVGDIKDYDCISSGNSMIINKITWAYFSVPQFTRITDLATTKKIPYTESFWRWGDFDSDGLLDILVTDDPVN